MPSLLFVVDVILGCVTLYIIQRLLTRTGATGPYPPGPKPLPLIGNLLDMPTTQQWLTFMRWGDTYGGVMSITVLGQRFVILNSAQAALDLLEKRGAKYAGRPFLVAAGEMIGWDQSLVLHQYTDKFRGMRRMLRQFMGGRNQVSKFYGIQEEESRRFLRRVMRDPKDISQHIRKNAGALILKLGYGYEMEEDNDALIDLVDGAVQGFIYATSPGAFLVDNIPALRYIPSWFPWAGWKNRVQAWRKETKDMCDIPYDMAKSKFADHAPEAPNFVALNGSSANTPELDFVARGAAAALYSGGADTTVSSIYSFFLAMTLNPEVQKKAQAEIDAVVGHDRLPSFEDKDSLPYVSALCSEVFRWMPIAPLGVPHRLLDDDTYDGYFLPKGTVFIPNIWKFTHDPETYSDPLSFKPERFLSDKPELDPRTFVFGFGRRICPGLHLAEASVFITCATTLAAFDISKLVIDGKEITPTAESMDGTISHPRPFQCSIKPRSSKAEALILSEDS